MALAGTWESLPGDSPWVSLEVHQIRPEWAAVRVVWRRHRDDAREFRMPARAKLLTVEGLHLAAPFRMTFRLSEDHSALVGTGTPPARLALLLRSRERTALAEARPLPAWP
jgi:hypothetical protein